MLLFLTFPSPIHLADTLHLFPHHPIFSLPDSLKHLPRICEEESRSQCLNSEKEEKGSREPETSEERGEQEEKEQQEQQLEEQQEGNTFLEKNQGKYLDKQGQRVGEQEQEQEQEQKHEQLQEQEQKHKEKTEGPGAGEKGEEKHGISPGSRFLPEVFENNKITIV